MSHLYPASQVYKVSIPGTNLDLYHTMSTRRTTRVCPFSKAVLIDRPAHDVGCGGLPRVEALKDSGAWKQTLTIILHLMGEWDSIAVNYLFTINSLSLSANLRRENSKISDIDKKTTPHFLLPRKYLHWRPPSSFTPKARRLLSSHEVEVEEVGTSVSRY